MGIINKILNKKDTIYKFLQEKSGIRNRIKFFEIDFKKPWWKIFLKQRFAFALVLVSESVQSIFDSLTLLILGLVVSQQNYIYLIIYTTIYLFLEILNRVSLYTYQNAFSSIQGSLNQQGFRFFLTVDPIHHSTKSTGVIQSKINSAGSQLTGMLDVFLFDILPISIGYFSIVVTLFSFSRLLGLVGVVFFILITMVSFVGNVTVSKVFTSFWIKKRERWNAIAIENLYQNNLIRSTFSTDKQTRKLETATKDGLEARTIAHFSRSLLIFCIRLLIISSIVIISAIIINMTQSGSIEVVTGTALLLTFVRGSGQIMRIGRVVTRFTEGVENMNDLWKFINNFGQQTFPVLDKD